MSVVTEILSGILVAFLGFQIGSIVEYRKKYNFADLELDLIKAEYARLKGLLVGAENAVKKVL